MRVQALWKRIMRPDLGFVFEGLADADSLEGIWVNGNLDFAATQDRRVAIVGTRRPTAYGMETAREIALALARRGAVIVSGLAYGIDRIAHEAALEAGSQTLAVLGTGLGQVYPSQHRRLQEEIIPNQGAVISEFSPEAQTEPWHFPARNRLIAAASKAVIVIEGEEKSGALITGRLGAEMGKEVYALPGSMYSSMSRGPNRLIQEGAFPILSVEDLLESLSGSITLTTGATARISGLNLSALHQQVIQSLSAKPMKLEEIVQALRTGVEEASRALLELEVAGVICETDPYGYIVADSEKRFKDKKNG